jgi:hypothetical protein
LAAAGLVAAGLGGALLGGAFLGSAPAWADARVNVEGPEGGARADLSHASTLKLTGSGFQSIAGGFGGIYVLFGWVSDPASGAWKPSQGGTTGTSYRYIPDVQDRDNAGYEKFVAFPGSETAASANGGLISADGSWSTTLNVPGPTFQSTDANGAVITTDCRRVTCGVITIGAHGVVNPTNETFTPVEFTDLAAGAGEAPAAPATASAPSASTTPRSAKRAPAASKATGPAAGNAAGGAAGQASGSATGQTSPQATPSGSLPADAAPSSPDPAATRAPATLGIDPTTAVAGHAMTFTAQGLNPGEQAVAVLDDGLLATGPIPVGEYGEVAGVMELPEDLRVGTHMLRVTGAASGLQPTVEITVRKDPAAVEAAEILAAAAEAPSGTAVRWEDLAIGIPLAALVAAIALGLATSVRRRRARKPRRKTVSKR